MGCGASRLDAPDAPPTGSLPLELRSMEYEPEEVLGEGAFGQVYLVEHRPTDNKYAAKRLKKAQVNATVLETEVSILKTCRHANITFLREVLLPAADESDIYLIMELARGGSLHDRIEEEGALPVAYAASVTIQIASALDYLHGHDIVHRDMKPENVLLLERHNRSLVKLCDFGLSKMMAKPAVAGVTLPHAASRAELMKSRVGSHYYASPELLQELPYDASVDLWGLGHIVFMSLTGTHPFDGSMDVWGDVCNAPKGLTFTHVSWDEAPDARRLCETLLCAQPRSRPTPSAVLHHTWLVAAPRRDRRIDLSLRYLGRVASMRDVCLRCLGNVLPPQYATGLQQAFDTLDSDVKGYLNPNDVRRALKPKRERTRGSQSRESTTVDEADESAPETSVRSPPAASGGVEAPDVRKLLRRLLQSALDQTGVGQKHKERRAGRNSLREAHGARRVGVVSFSMFTEAALEDDKGLCRRLWNAAFAMLDHDKDGVVSAADLQACLRTLGVVTDDTHRAGFLSEGTVWTPEALQAMLTDTASGRCNSTDLLRLVLKGEDAAAVAATKTARRSPSCTQAVAGSSPTAKHAFRA